MHIDSEKSRLDDLETVIVTGADAAHFANLRVLLGSWLSHMNAVPLAVCDFGLKPEQARELTILQNVRVLPPPVQFRHPWHGKALAGSFIGAGHGGKQRLVAWIDADALFAAPLPTLAPLMDGYDILIDAHVQSVGEIVHDCNLSPLNLRKDDAYFSSGFWIVRGEVLFDSFARFAGLVAGQGNLWENDAFVAAIYHEKLRVRTVAGGVWHARGKTSLHTCAVRGGRPFHGEQPIYVLHANDGYSIRGDGRRVFNRPELAEIQDRYEKIYLAALGR